MNLGNKIYMHQKNWIFPSLPLYSPDVTLETEEKLGHKIRSEESATKVELELQENKPISCLPWLNTRQHCQLENCGFHMIGLLCENIKFFYVLIIIIGHGFTFLSCSCSQGSFRNLFLKLMLICRMHILE